MTTATGKVHSTATAELLFFDIDRIVDNKPSHHMCGHTISDSLDQAGSRS
jgi:hypothetical protein